MARPQLGPGSARCTNEDNYVLARFARGVLGHHLDCSLRTGERSPPGDRRSRQLRLIVLVGNDPKRSTRGGGRVYARDSEAPADRNLRAPPCAGPTLRCAPRRPSRTEATCSRPAAPTAEAGTQGPGEVITRVSPRSARRSSEDCRGQLRGSAEGRFAVLGAARVTLVYSSSLTLSPSAVPRSRPSPTFRHCLAQVGPQVSLLALASRNNLQAVSIWGSRRICCQDTVRSRTAKRPRVLPSVGDASRVRQA